LNGHGWPHFLIKSSASVLWLNRVTQWFPGEPLQAPRTRCSLGSTLVLRLNQNIIHDFILPFLQSCGPHLTLLATGSLERPTCLLHTWRPHQQRPFALVLHLYQYKPSRNQHLQYLAKNQSTQHCQSLITPGSDHPLVLEPHMVLTKDEIGCLFWEAMLAPDSQASGSEALCSHPNLAQGRSG
jgi:hypothetical protein